MRDDYTDALLQHEPIAFEEFALLCARSDPHLLTMLYEELEQVPLPQGIGPDGEYLFQLRKAEARLTEVDAWDAATAETQAAAGYRRASLEFELSLLTRRHELNRLHAMYAAAEAWEPPTSEHRWLKGFMLDQLRDALEARADPLEPPPRSTGCAYRSERLAAARRAVAHYRLMHEQALSNAERTTKWLRLLRASLSMPSDA